MTTKIEWTRGDDGSPGVTWNPTSSDGYEVSIDGLVRSWRNNGGGRRTTAKLLSPMTNKDGYQYVLLRDGRRHRKCFIHRLVLEAFSGLCPPGHECRHLDGDPTNNHVGNLAWGTRVEQCQDRRRHGTELRGEMIPCSVLDREKVRMIRSDTRSSRVIAQEMGCSHTTLLKVRRNERWVA